MIHNRKNRNNLSGFYIVFNGGVLNEVPGNRGWSHLCEHLMCHQMSQLEGKFTTAGVTWNAYTSSYTVCFFFYGLDFAIRRYRQKFLELVLSPLPDQATFENEKKIILEEYKGAFATQGGTHINNLYRKRYNFFLPIGDRQDIENASYDQVVAFHRANFSKPSEIVNISRTPFESAVEFNRFGTEKTFTKMPPDFVVNEEHTSSFAEKTSIVYTMPTCGDDAYCTLIAAMFGNGLYSPLMQEVRIKRGLVYSIRAGVADLSSNFSEFSVGTITSDANVANVREVIDQVLYNGKKFLTKKRFHEVVSQNRNLLKIGDIELYKSGESLLEPATTLNQLVRRNEVSYEKMLEVYERRFNSPMDVYLDK